MREAQRHFGPVVVDVDGSERLVEALALRMCSAPHSGTA
jgi:hypothetical protein